MIRRVVKRPAAKADLTDHFVHIGSDSLTVAERFLARAEETFQLLAARSRIGRPWRSHRRGLAGSAYGLFRGFETILCSTAQSMAELRLFESFMAHGT